MKKLKTAVLSTLGGKICFGFPMGNVKNGSFLFGDAGGAETPHTSPLKHNTELKRWGDAIWPQ